MKLMLAKSANEHMIACLFSNVLLVTCILCLYVHKDTEGLTED